MARWTRTHQSLGGLTACPRRSHRHGRRCVHPGRGLGTRSGLQHLQEMDQPTMPVRHAGQGGGWRRLWGQGAWRLLSCSVTSGSDTNTQCASAATTGQRPRQTPRVGRLRARAHTRETPLSKHGRHVGGCGGKPGLKVHSVPASGGGVGRGRVRQQGQQQGCVPDLDMQLGFEEPLGLQHRGVTPTHLSTFNVHASRTHDRLHSFVNDARREPLTAVPCALTIFPDLHTEKHLWLWSDLKFLPPSRSNSWLVTGNWQEPA